MGPAENHADRSSCPRKASDPPDSVTVLTSRGPLATKRIIWAPGAAKPTIEPYGNAKVFSISEHAVGSIDDVAQLLSNLEHSRTAFIVRGRPAEGIARHYAYRRLHTRTKRDGTIEPATIEPAAHHWIPLDLDSIDCPDCPGPVHDPNRTVEYAVSQLPEVFHGATCWWSFTSGQGLKPGIRIRLFFWADRALADWELKSWLSGYPVDQSIFAPAQPVYVARPIFIGMPDPVPIRSGIWRGDRDVITPPAIEKVKASAPRATAEAAGVPGSGYEFHRSRIGDHENGEGFFAPIKSAAASWIARQGGSADTGWLRADLERAIRRARRDPAKHPDEYIETRVRDLDTLIAAIVGLQAANEAEKGGGECEPTYPAPLASVEEAREQLVHIFDEHLSSISAYAAAKRAYEAALK
jgi:hypothetical protein